MLTRVFPYFPVLCLTRRYEDEKRGAGKEQGRERERADNNNIEQTKGALNVREDMQAPLRTLQDTARRIAKVAQECKVTIDVEEYVEKFKPAMIDLVYLTTLSFLSFCLSLFFFLFFF